MFIRILRRTFWSWWDHLSYSIFTSFNAAVNPFFIFLMAGLWVFYTRGDFFTQNAGLFFVLITTCLFAMPFFPTALASYSYQAKIIDDEITSIFKEYFLELKRVFWKGIFHSLLNGLIGFLLSYSIIYYQQSMTHLFPLNIILTGLSVWFLFILLMMQIILLPLLTSDEYRFHEYYMVAFFLTFKKALPLFLVSVVNILFFVLLTVPIVSPFLTVVPIISYFGLVSTLHIWTFRYADGAADPKEKLPKRNIGELFSPFRIRKNRQNQLKIEDKDKQDSEQADEEIKS